MADSTISLTVAGEVPTTVTLLTLTRADTGAAVSFGSGVFTSTGGAWVKTFAPPATGVDYNYTFRLTWADASTDDAAGNIYVPSDEPPTDADLNHVRIAFNVDRDANLSNDNDPAEIASRRLLARQKARNRAASEFAGAGADWPLDSDSDHYDRLTDALAHYAVGWLQSGRYDIDRQNGLARDEAVERSYIWHLDHAVAEFRAIAAVASPDDDAVGAGEWSMVEVDRGADTTATDENSQ